MTTSLNGFGTSYHGNEAPIRWGKPGSLTPPADHDAVRCIIAAVLPLFPLEAVHTFRWKHRECRVVPIRRTPALLARALLRPYVILATSIAGFVTGCLLLVLLLPLFVPELGNSGGGQRDPSVMAFFYAVPFALAAGIALLAGWGRASRASRDLRLIIGPHERGSSDPALWAEPAARDNLPASLLQDSEQALIDGQFSKAMFGARQLAGAGDHRGETLTDKILGDRRVAKVLPLLRKSPWRREELLPDDRSLRMSLAVYLAEDPV